MCKNLSVRYLKLDWFSNSTKIQKCVFYTLGNSNFKGKLLYGGYAR